MQAPTETPPVFTQQRYMVRKKLLTLLGAAFHVYDAAGNVIGYSRLKAFRLREDIRLFTGEDMQSELLWIKARQIIDFSAAYDVIDAQTQERVGTLKRRGLKSFLRDEWAIEDAEQREIGTIREDSLVLALIRRFILKLIPQEFHVTDEAGGALCQFSQKFNPFVVKLDVDFSVDPEGRLDRRLGLAAAILLCAIEGRQD